MRARAGRPPARRGGPSRARPPRRAGARRARAGRARCGPPSGASGSRSRRGSRAGTPSGGRGSAPRTGVASAIAIGERLERAGALVPRLADRGEEERLLDPGLRVGEEVRARHEHRVVGRRARRADRPRAGTGAPARTASSRGRGRRRRGRSSPTRPTPPRRARSTSRLSASRLPRVCHQTQPWQTVGAVSRVAPVRPASREVVASILASAESATAIRAHGSSPCDAHQLRHLRPGEQPEGDERRPEPGRDVEHGVAER